MALRHRYDETNGRPALFSQDSLPIPKPAKQLSPRPDLLCDMNEEKAGVRHLADAIEEEEEEGEVYSWPANLEGAIQRLREALEDYQEHSSTLKSLYDLVTELDSILGVSDNLIRLHLLAGMHLLCAY